MLKVHNLFETLFQVFSILIRSDGCNLCAEHSMITRSRPEAVGLKSIVQSCWWLKIWTHGNRGNESRPWEGKK